MKSKYIVLGMIVALSTQLPLLAQEASVEMGSGEMLQEALLKGKKKPNRKVVAVSIGTSSGPTLQDVLFKSNKKRNRKFC